MGLKYMATVSVEIGGEDKPACALILLV